MSSAMDGPILRGRYNSQELNNSFKTIRVINEIIGLVTFAWKGAQWLSGRVLDSRPRGRGFEPNWRHCVVVLEQDTFILA